jgi:hypothetical protein
VAGTEIKTITSDLSEFEWLQINAKLIGPTGGTLDVYLQRQIVDDIWVDWCHFNQVAAGVTVGQCLSPESSLTCQTVGIGTTLAPGVAMAAGSCSGGNPGKKIRAVFVSGAGTSAGKAQLIHISGWNQN